ncbi:MAG: chorismate-binding protein [Prevotella sp.]|uniref:chorismate-binding protein n=1 Tax=Prevotella sp. TaxID=59823 RepID=UPI002A7F1930|nr:chorismate-binding protein [Prevotella sp.]MDY4020130.1 chorismate-binding protein [Prevotella sp.]
MRAFAFFRLPKESKCTLVVQRSGEPERMASPGELNGRSGFVVAPFSVSRLTPLLLIRPEEQHVYDEVSNVTGEIIAEVEKCAQRNNIGHTAYHHDESERELYGRAFGTFHSRLMQGTFRKIVLARCHKAKGDTSNLFNLFRRACEEYPRMYVSLFSTNTGGTWLIATPEVLLEGDSCRWKTIALAGTMKPDDGVAQCTADDAEYSPGLRSGISWNEKNIKEQRIVADYMKDCLDNFSDDVEEEGPLTARAGNLLHLRSDFAFSLRSNAVLGDLIDAIHPTPAVCGLPKSDSKEFIMTNEVFPRRYYSGFCGPLLGDCGTHLFVALRCMQVVNDGFLLYAGSGLLPDSTEQQEWEETEAKLETMKKIIS